MKAIEEVAESIRFYASRRGGRHPTRVALFGSEWDRFERCVREKIYPPLAEVEVGGMIYGVAVIRGKGS